MNNNYFDDILKNSMETPRAIPFDESAWERMEQKMPQPETPSTWKTWLKFLPIAIGMLGLLTWNICLQREINYMQKHPNLVVETKGAKPEVIYKIDTIYKITESKVTEETIKQYIEQYVKTGLSHTNNRFVAPTNSSLLIPNPLITSNFNKDFSGSYNPNSLKSNLITPSSNRNFFTSKPYNPHFYNLNIPSSSGENQMDSSQSIDLSNPNKQVFANQTSNNESEFDKNSKNVTTTGNTNKDIVLNDVDIEEKVSTKNVLNELENKTLQEISYYQNLHNLELIDIVDLSRPKQIKPNLKNQLRFNEFSLGVGNSLGLDILNNSTLGTYGIHAGAYILPNTSLEVELNYLTSNASIYNSTALSYSLPYPTSQQIPADYSLNNINLDISSIQMSIGLKRIMFKNEHIRPFGEIGWLPSKELVGSVYYGYSKREANQSLFTSIAPIPLENTYNLKWNLSRVYAGGGLSFSLFKNKVDLDLGVRFTQNLNAMQFSIFNNNLTSTSSVGSFTSLTYNF